ncbi:MAG: flippase [Candidatus Acidiferrales bacterium]
MEAHTLQRKRLLVKGSALNLLGQVLPMLVGIAVIPYLVHGLGVNGYGILSIAYLVLGYFSIFNLGLSRATVKFVAEHLSPDRVHKVPEIVWTSFLLLVGIGTAVGLSGAFFVPWAVTSVFKMPPSFVEEARIGLFILCASMPMMLGTDALRGVLEAAQRFDLINAVRVPTSVGFFALAALAVALHVKVPGVILILVAVRFSSGVAYMLLCMRVFPGLRSGPRFSKAALRPLTVFGGWIMVSNITGPVFGYIERFMIASILSVGMLTYYTVPFDVVGKVLIFPMSVVPSLFPYFSYHGDRGREAVRDVTTRTAKYILLALTPITAVFVFFAHDILRLWMGAPFAAQSAGVMQIVAILFFVNAFSMIPYTSVQALGRPELKAILDVLVLPFYIALAWWLMHRSGVEGAAVAKLLLTAFDCFFLYLFAWKMKAFSVRDCFSGPLFRAIGISAGLFACVFVVRSLNLTLIPSGLLLLVCFGVYAGVFWMIAVDTRERTTLKGLAQQGFAVIANWRSRTVVQPSGNSGL